ncbi:MAG TPA: PAS domain S-box protein [Natrialbaceae archaeon]|nr:PAS domain S-box protein [Natrialbaceae archaeon]
MYEASTVRVVGDEDDVISLRAGFDDRPGNGPTVARVDAIGNEIDRLETEPPACLVCVTLPEPWSSGDVLAAVRDRRPDLPVVIVTDDERVRGLAGSEATTVLASDATGDRIAAAVEETIDRAAATSDRTMRAKERFETLFERVPDPVVISHRSPGEGSTIVEHVNPAFEDVFGYDAAEIRGEPVDRYLVPDDEESSPVDLSDAGMGETVETEVSRRTADGRRDFLFRGVKADVAGGTEFVGIYTEITSRKRRTRRLNELHGTTRSLLGGETIEDVCETAVEAASEILGLQATGIHLDPRVLATFDRGARTTQERLIPVAASAGARTLFGGEPPAYTSENESVWSAFTSGEPLVLHDVPASDVEPTVPVGSALVLPLGEFGVMISSSADRHAFDEATVDLAKLLAANVEVALERAIKEAALQDRERELRTERDRLAALFENVPIPVANVSLAGDRATVRDVNPAFESTFGYDEGTIVGEDLDEYVSPPDGRDAARTINQQVVDGDAVEAEVQRGTADGLREFLLTVAPVPSETAADTTAYAFYIDITERKQRQQRLRVLSRVLRHDIRNRMNIIDGNASLIVDRATADAIEQPADRIRRAADDLLDLNRKTRIVERTVAGGPSVERADVGSALRMVGSAVDDRYPAHSIGVDLPEEGTVETTRALVVAIEELVENAAEHHDRDAGHIEVRVDVGPDFLEIEVVDDGPGVPEDELAYVRGEREQTQVEHSSGIGLWMINWIVRTLGGELAFKDNDPRGTIVRVTVPREREE